MNRDMRVREICNVAMDMGGLPINGRLNDETACVLIGGVLFAIRSHAVGDKHDVHKAVQNTLEAAGGKWIDIDDAVTDIRHALEEGVHYSTANAAANLDASIDSWCSLYRVNINQKQSAGLVALLTAGGAKC